MPPCKSRTGLLLLIKAIRMGPPGMCATATLVHHYINFVCSPQSQNKKPILCVVNRLENENIVL